MVRSLRLLPLSGRLDRMRITTFTYAGLLLVGLLDVSLFGGNQYPSAASSEGLFDRDNLVAWCIVPFDAKKRGPEARVEMLKNL